MLMSIKIIDLSQYNQRQQCYGQFNICPLQVYQRDKTSWMKTVCSGQSQTVSTSILASAADRLIPGKSVVSK